MHDALMFIKNISFVLFYSTIVIMHKKSIKQLYFRFLSSFFFFISSYLFLRIK